MMENVRYQKSLSEDELRGIYQLIATGGAAGISYKVDPGISSGILLTVADEIRGFMTVDDFNGQEIESAAIVGSVADWQRMNEMLVAYGKEKQATRLLYICDPLDQQVISLLEASGLEPAFSEYRMVLDPQSFQEMTTAEVTLRKATSADEDFLVELERGEYGELAYQMSAAELQQTWMIQKAGLIVGKLRLEQDPQGTGIYGVIVAPEFRGLGYGGQGLRLLIQQLLADGVASIYLEVDSENPAALHLYRKLGFVVSSEFRYFSLQLT